VVRFQPALDKQSQRLVSAALSRLPRIEGKPVLFHFLPALTSCRGKLLSAQGRGTEIHAASFMRQRLTVLDRALLAQPRELARILIHELFHYSWIRLGNKVRWSFEDLLRSEAAIKARGELGWSAWILKRCLSARDVVERTPAWRAYACESFCDSAAYFYSGISSHAEFTLASRFRKIRVYWFSTQFGSVISI